MVRIRFEELHYLFNKTGPLPIGAEADASDEATVAKEPGGFDLSPLTSPLIITSSEKKTIIYII